MRLLDANVVIYAIGREHFYRRPCQLLMEQAQDQPDDFVIDVEALQEVLHFYSRRGELNRGIESVEGLLSRLPNIIPVSAAEIRVAMRLMSETRNLSARDAIHAAVVIEHGLEGIISADGDFVRIPGLRRFDPIALASE